MFTPKSMGYNSNRRSGSGAVTPLNSSQRPLSRNKSLANSRLSFASPVDSRSPFSNSRRQSCNVSLNQSSVLFPDNANYNVRTFGSSLPVLVTEALTLADRSLETSAKLSNFGWAWLVCGRRLFIWKYTANSNYRPVSFCRELILPPSDLAHKADLVCILINKDILTPAAIAVSPEGIVRYWASIAHESASSELTIDLQGQECFCLTNIQPLGCIVATTTSSLVQLIPTVIDGQYSIISQTLRVPHGVLAGIGRRVSSFIFGGVPNQSLESKQLTRVLAEDAEDEDSKYVYVVSGNSIQKWLLNADEAERLVLEVDLDAQLQENFMQAFHCQEHNIKSWVVDMQLSEKGLLILGACSIPQGGQATNIQYAFAFVLLDREAPGIILSFSPLKHKGQMVDWNDERIPSFHLILPNPKGNVAFLHDSHQIICIFQGNDEEVIEIGKYDDRILGTGVCEDLPLFFSSTHGILSVYTFSEETSFSVNNSKLLEAANNHAEIEQMTQSEDKKSRLRAAFLIFCRNEVSKSQAIIVEDFIGVAGYKPHLDSELDLSVMLLSKDLIDEFPASDPRWMASVPNTTSLTSSVILVQQLMDKLRVQEMFVNFLKGTSVLPKLHSVSLSQEDRPTNTRFLLCQHSEKLKAAITLQSLHTYHGDFLNKAIERVIHTRGTTIPARLTIQDVFYREASVIEDIFLALFDEEKEKLEDADPKDALGIIMAVNTVFLEVLQSVNRYKQDNAWMYESESSIDMELISWTSTSGHSGLRTILLDQFVLTVDHCKVMMDDVQPIGTIFQQILDLADLILDGFCFQLQSIGQGDLKFEEVNQQYCQIRTDLITSLLDADQHERAAALAEKYCEFRVLVKLCEKTNNQDRLQRYMIQFADQGFPNFLFKWYLDEGKRGQLLSQPSSQHEEVARFLESHENLSWLHHFNTGDFGIAQKLLHALAKDEKQFLNRKKSLLSLSKLAAWASDDPRNVTEYEIKNIINDQDILLYQETLPVSVLDACGLDFDNMRVLLPQELIDMYISHENLQANEYDFKKALDLLAYCKGDSLELEVLRMHIWCRAIQRDCWENMDATSPVESVRETLFFKLVDLALTQDVNMHNFLPALNDILECEEELGSLVKEPHFVFMLKAGFEHIEQMLD